MGDFTYTMIEDVNKEEIDKLLEDGYKEAMDTFNRGSAEDMMKIYAEDCVFLHGVSNLVVQGNKEVLEIYKEFVKKYSDYNFVPIHRTYMKNAVGEIGTVSVTRKDTGEVKVAKYASLTVKKDGRWQCQYDIVGNDEM